jgi:hypothetical protein
MAQLGASNMQKGELLEALSVLPLKRLPCLMVLRKLALKEDDCSHKGPQRRHDQRQVLQNSPPPLGTPALVPPPL